MITKEMYLHAPGAGAGRRNGELLVQSISRSGSTAFGGAAGWLARE